MPRVREIPFILSLFFVILLHPQCFACQKPIDYPALPIYSSVRLVLSSSSNPLPQFATSFDDSISETLKKIISPNHIPIISSSSSPAPTPNPNPNPPFKSICDSTNNPEICLSRVSPFLSLDASGNVDHHMVVLEASIKACIEQLTDDVRKMKTKIDYDFGSGSSISYCKDNYENALDCLKNALDGIHSCDIGTINSMLSGVLLDISTCEDALKETMVTAKDSPSQMEEFEELIKRLASNCLAIASMIHH